MLILLERVLDLVVLDLFLVVYRLLQAYQLSLIAHQQVFGRNPASKISLSVLLCDTQNLLWLSKFFLFKVLYRMLFLTILDALSRC